MYFSQLNQIFAFWLGIEELFDWEPSIVYWAYFQCSYTLNKQLLMPASTGYVVGTLYYYGTSSVFQHMPKVGNLNIFMWHNILNASRFYTLFLSTIPCCFIHVSTKIVLILDVPLPNVTSYNPQNKTCCSLHTVLFFMGWPIFIKVTPESCNAEGLVLCVGISWSS